MVVQFPVQLGIKKNGRSPFCLGLFSTCGEDLPAHILPNILTGIHRDTCKLIREVQSCTRSSGGQWERQGKVQRAGPVVVIRVSHRPVITKQTHSDQAGQDQAGKSVCGSGSARLGIGSPTSQFRQAPSHH